MFPIATGTDANIVAIVLLAGLCAGALIGAIAVYRSNIMPRVRARRPQRWSRPIGHDGHRAANGYSAAEVRSASGYRSVAIDQPRHTR